VLRGGWRLREEKGVREARAKGSSQH
jgi:hypothetical protein